VYATETVIGRMVPGTRSHETDPLTVSAEPFHELPFNASQWPGGGPNIPGLVPVPGAQFHAYELRKLFLHNAGHATLAYHGYRYGYETIRECADDEALVEELHGFWSEVCSAFRRSEYRQTPVFATRALEAFTGDLLTRFRNPYLKDTVLRVARDPLRKLSRNERLVGAALFCEQHGVEPVYVSRAIAAALHFSPPEDAGAAIIQQSLQETGLETTLVRHTVLEPNSPLIASIGRAFHSLLPLT
ncbi:MAG: hypothetical protein H8F28_08180, partial [Fibrella sp.]|nr:hypothetical protein [Armatimonadota bacterium]